MSAPFPMLLRKFCLPDLFSDKNKARGLRAVEMSDGRPAPLRNGVSEIVDDSMDHNADFPRKYRRFVEAAPAPIVGFPWYLLSSVSWGVSGVG
mmetsp:Transcript_27498/g.60500  ORF Transcript_27498/g.60500 Transcript_27498/m.60500 type:complete len:93 (-) Transcript_27498:1404-1682(-)